MSDDGSGVPVAVTVKGDPAAIEKVLDKLRAQAHGSAATLGSDSSGDLVAIGPDGGVPEAGPGRWPPRRHRRLPRAWCPTRGTRALVLYVDLDDLDKVVVAGVGRATRRWPTTSTPLRAFGFSVWTDGDVARTSLKISTN